MHVIQLERQNLNTVPAELRLTLTALMFSINTITLRTDRY